jgi:glutaredoxin
VIAAGKLSVLEAEAPEPMVRYVDSEGSTRMVRGLARVPAAHRADAVVLRRDNVNIVNVPALSAAAFRDWQPAPNRNRHEVVLFSASWCGACESAKRYLDQHGVRYFERDIEADDSAKQEIVRILGQVAVPLLEVDGRYISGFRPDIYDRALR